MSMIIFGTTTSPFVRRVRVVALEKAMPFTLIDTRTDEGQARLRALSPLWKVPTVQLDDGRVVWDSGSILEELCAAPSSWAPLRPPAIDPIGRVFEKNALHAIDEALLSLVRLFYLRQDVRQDGVELPNAGFLLKESERAENLLDWLDAQVASSSWPQQGFGRLELALFSALHWIRFRQTADIDRRKNLVAFEATHGHRASLQATAPG